MDTDYGISGWEEVVCEFETLDTGGREVVRIISDRIDARLPVRVCIFDPNTDGDGYAAWFTPDEAMRVVDGIMNALCMARDEAR